MCPDEIVVRYSKVATLYIPSTSGITRASTHRFMYNVSKAASIQLNNLLAQELRRPGVMVRVNSIAPGVFPSEMTSERAFLGSVTSVIDGRL